MATICILGAGLGGIPMALEMREHSRRQDTVKVVCNSDRYQFIPPFKGIDALDGIDGLVNPKGFVLVDGHQQNTRYPNVFAVATWMVKEKMEKANIPALSDLQEMAFMEGVTFVACKMTVDMMKLKPEGFIEGVTIQTAAVFLQQAIECKILLYTFEKKPCLAVDGVIAASIRSRSWTVPVSPRLWAVRSPSMSDARTLPLPSRSALRFYPWGSLSDPERSSRKGV